MTAASQRYTVVGVFEDRQKANEAVSELLSVGFRQDQIGVAMRQAPGESGTAATAYSTDDAESSHTGTGVIAGALTGLGLGALAGMGVLAGVIPVVGPAIAAGTLGVILSNAAAGAGIAGLAGALIGAGVPEHEAKYYGEEFEAGRTIVTVTSDGPADQATAILRRHGAYDVSNRREAASVSHTATPSAATYDVSSRSEAASVSHTATPGAKAESYAPASRARGHEGGTFQVKEERLHAEKRPVETGEVNVRKEVRTETKSMEVPVQREEVIIERTPAHGRAASEGIDAGDIGEGEQIRVPVREEQITITKEPVVTEEVKVGKRTVQDTKHVSGEVRKEEIKVDQAGNVDVKNRGTGKDTSSR